MFHKLFLVWSNLSKVTCFCVVFCAHRWERNGILRRALYELIRTHADFQRLQPFKGPFSQYCLYHTCSISLFYRNTPRSNSITHLQVLSFKCSLFLYCHAPNNQSHCLNPCMNFLTRLPTLWKLYSLHGSIRAADWSARECMLNFECSMWKTYKVHCQTFGAFYLQCSGAHFNISCFRNPANQKEERMDDNSCCHIDAFLDMCLARTYLFAKCAFFSLMRSHCFKHSDRIH